MDTKNSGTIDHHDGPVDPSTRSAGRLLAVAESLDGYPWGFTTPAAEIEWASRLISDGIHPADHVDTWTQEGSPQGRLHRLRRQASVMTTDHGMPPILVIVVSVLLAVACAGVYLWCTARPDASPAPAPTAALTQTSTATHTTVDPPFHRPRWGDLDHDGLDTRADVLAATCGRVTWDPRHRHVRHAECLDLYSGAVVATDAAAQALQVDHLYPASVAWHRKAWYTDTGTRCAYAESCSSYVKFFNDTSNLVVTRSRTNGRKSDKMPGEWCPADPAARAVAAVKFINIRNKYDLPTTPDDALGLTAWAGQRCAPGAAVLGGAE